MVTRNTYFTPSGGTDTKQAGEVTPVLCAMFLQVPESARVGLTLDSGKEFARHEALAQTTGLDVFLPGRITPWERGTNENTNGLIRRLYPKKSSFCRHW